MASEHIVFTHEETKQVAATELAGYSVERTVRIGLMSGDEHHFHATNGGGGVAYRIGDRGELTVSRSGNDIDARVYSPNGWAFVEGPVASAGRWGSGSRSR